MKFRTRLCSLLLAGVMTLSLAACSGEDAGDTSPSPSDGDAAVSDTPSPSPSSLLPEDFAVDTSVEDLCLATTGVPGDFTLFTVNGDPVTAYSYLYWLTSNASYIESYYGALDWTSDSSLVEYMKESSLNAAVQYHLVAAKAKELGFELTQEQIDELEGNLALTVMMMGGEEAFQEALRMSGFDYDAFYNANAASYYYARLRDGLYAGQPTDGEMDAYIAENDILYAKHILLMTVDSSTREPLDEETVAQKKATAEDILAQLQSSTDLEADFDALMHQYSEDPGLASYPDGYTFTAGEMVAEFESATRALEFGQISGIVESSTTGYHIILRQDPDTETARADYRADLLDEQLDIWFSEADVVLSEEYEALDVPLFYAKYVAYQEAFAAEAAEEAAEEAAAEPSAEPSTN